MPVRRIQTRRNYGNLNQFTMPAEVVEGSESNAAFLEASGNRTGNSRQMQLELSEHQRQTPQILDIYLGNNNSVVSIPQEALVRHLMMRGHAVDGQVFI